MDTTVLEASVSSYDDCTVRLQVVIACENKLIVLLEMAKLERWIEQLAQQSGGVYGTTRIVNGGEAEYGELS